MCPPSWAPRSAGQRTMATCVGAISVGVGATISEGIWAGTPRRPVRAAGLNRSKWQPIGLQRSAVRATVDGKKGGWLLRFVLRTLKVSEAHKRQR